MNVSNLATQIGKLKETIILEDDPIYGHCRTLPDGRVACEFNEGKNRIFKSLKKAKKKLAGPGYNIVFYTVRAKVE